VGMGRADVGVVGVLSRQATIPVPIHPEAEGGSVCWGKQAGAVGSIGIEGGAGGGEYVR
jgi:hypothetical protein